MPIAPGTRFGPYEISAPIGEGGMGEVYRATDTALPRQVAIKVLPPAVAPSRVNVVLNWFDDLTGASANGQR